MASASAYEADAARGASAALIQNSRCLSALRQPHPHPSRYPQEKTRDRATLEVRLVQARLHARATSSSKQELSASYDARGTH
jgi:hypothetical protein